MKRMLNLSSVIEKTRSWYSCGVLLCVLLASAPSTAAQTTPSPGLQPDRGAHTPGAHSISDLENISLTNGNLNLTIPLASLPPSAGGNLSWTINAIYNSKLLDVKSDQQPADIYHQNQPYYLKYLQTNPQVGGWQVGGRYEIYQQLIDEEIQVDGCVGSLECYYATFRYKYFLITPDGARHELRPLDAPTCIGCPLWREGYFAQTPDNSGGAMRYYSYDGSYLWAVINPSGSATAWTVYMKDGMRITMSGGIERIYDTNGNSIAIYSTIDPAGNTTTHYVDERTNREIKLYRPFGSSSTQAQYQKAGGAWETITVNWGTTAVYGLVYNVDDRSCQPSAREHSDTLSVIRSIVLPQTEPSLPGRSFSFNYNSDTAATAVPFQYNPSPSCTSSPVTVTAAARGWGQLSRMTMPTSAYVDYTWQWDNVPNKSALLIATEQIAGETLTQKKVTYDGGQFSTWTYAIGSTSGTVTAPDTSVTTETFYTHNPAKSSSLAGINGLGGLVYRSDRAGKIRIERQWGLKTFSGAYAASPEGTVNFNNVVLAEYTTLLESGSPVKMAAKTFQYDFNGNVTQTTEYDWFDPALVSRDSDGVPTAVPGSAIVLRTTTNSYYNPADASSSTNVYAKRALATAQPLILSAPRDVITGPSQTRFSFDGQAWGTAPTVGNLTKVSRWDDQGSQWLNTTYAYDAYGNRATMTDHQNNVTTYTYDTSTHAQPTQVTVDPLNGTGQQTITTVYDYSTGRVTSQTDANGQITTTDYTNQRLGTVDPFARPGIVTGPAVTSVVSGVTYTNQHQKAKTTYYDSARQIVVETDLNQEGDYKLKSRASADQLGRATLTERNEDGTANYTISAQTVYIQMGLITLTSNPKRSGATTDGWTRATRDTLGRVTEIATFSGTSQPPSSGTNSNWTGTVATSYYSNQTTVTDQAGKLRRSVTDGLGRLAQVIEDPNVLNYQTNYTYDTLGNLRKVAQGAQNRFFMYDSLSRLIRAKNPEQDVNTSLNLTDPITSNSQWAMKYTYYANGNLYTRTDARNITTTYLYDGLNRNTSVSYTDSTPGVTRVYDTATLGKGRLYKTETAGSAGTRVTLNAYDAAGRPLSQGQQFFYSGAWGSSYTTQHSYNLAGSVASQTYPSNRAANYVYDSAGRASSVTGTLGDGALRNYATGITYTAAGLLTKEQFGTGTALYHRQHYNNRLQLFDMRIGTDSSTVNDGNNNASWTMGSQDRGSIQLYYNTNYAIGDGGSNNNGNVWRMDTFVPLASDPWTGWSAAIDYYNYDALNRITLGVEQSYGNVTQTPFVPWQQAYQYDPYGNRTIDPNQTFGGAGNSTPYNYTVRQVPGTIQAEDYDLGGQNVAYNDADTANQGGQYRTSEGVDIEANDGGYTVGYTNGGEWIKYTINVTTTGTYSLTTRLGSALSGATFHIEIDSVNKTGSLTMPNTGSWTVFTTISTPGISLSRGQHVMKLVIEGTGTGKGNFNWFQWTLTSAGGTTTPTNAINNLVYGISTTSNRLTVPSGQSGAIEYDAAGNLKRDTWNGVGFVRLNYDAENRVTSATDDSGAAIYGSYTYDGDGKRVRRLIAGVETWQVYGIGGELVAEYAAGGATNAPQKEYGYRNGQLLVTAVGSTVTWLMPDQLSSTRLELAASGAWNAVTRHDYLPFGEEIGANVGVRSNSGSGYATSSIRQRYVGYERDNETGLDFAQARYYANVQGRFTSVDPYNIVMETQFSEDRKEAQKQFVGYLTNPQRWNRYSYCLNNPLLYTDPNGEDVTIYYRAPKGLKELDFGHVLIYVRNDETGEGAYFDYYPDPETNSTVIGNVNDKRIAQHASFTIETNAVQEQAILDAIKDFQKSPADFSVSGGNVCTTTCSGFLEKGGLGLGKNLLPTSLWEAAFQKYAPDRLIKTTVPVEHGIKVTLTNAPYIPGTEFGKDPRGQARRQDANATNANVKTFYQGGKAININDYRPKR